MPVGMIKKAIPLELKRGDRSAPRDLVVDGNTAQKIAKRERIVWLTAAQCWASSAGTLLGWRGRVSVDVGVGGVRGMRDRIILAGNSVGEARQLPTPTWPLLRLHQLRLQ